MNKFVRPLLALMLLICTLNAASYEESTHAMLSQSAAVRSVLNGDPSLLNDLGLSPWGTPDYMATDIAGSRSILDIISHGAEYEDTQYSTRVFNHFFDPQYK